jgi:hypothetical protein
MDEMHIIITSKNCDELKYRFIAKGLYPNPFFKRGNVMNI